MKKKLEIEVGAQVAFNNLDDAVWFDVLEVNGYVLTIREHGSDYAKQFMDKGLVKQVKAPEEPLREAPKGAKSPVPPLPPRAPRIIDITPTWRAILPVLLTVYKDGNAAGQTEADRELHRMADLADIYVKLAKHSPETVRQLLDDIKVKGE